jgi:hypothetical protein
MGGELTESRFDPMTFGFDTMLKYLIKYKIRKYEKESGSGKRRMNYILYIHYFKQYYITLFYRETMSSDQETLK